MKNLGIVAALAGLCAGALGAVVVALFMAARSAPAAAEAVVPGASTEELAETLAVLSSEIAALNGRLAALEARPAAVPPREAVAEPVLTAADDAAFEEELRALVAALKADGGAPAALESTVERALENIREQEELERDVAREERRLERLDERVAQWTTELGLGTGQANDLRAALLENDVRRDAVRDQIREQGDWRSARDLMDEVQRETSARLQQILTADQFTKYTELNEESFGRWGNDAPRRRGAEGEEAAPFTYQIF